MQYVKFLASEGRLPLWQPAGGGEAGYEAQHPPLYYALMSLVYRATTPLAERWRWYALRWVTILLLGLPLFSISRRFFTAVFGGEPGLAFVATASVMLMPLTLLYTCHINPDGLALVWMSLLLLLAWQAARRRLPAPSAVSSDLPRTEGLWLGIVAGLALLTKLSAAPALVVALFAQMGASLGPHARAWLRSGWRQVLLTLIACAATCGWYYGRNAFLYGTPFIHTTGLFGTGLEAGLRTSLWSFAWLTWKNTYLSSWAQPGWFPAGFWNALLYGLIGLMTAGSVVGLVLQKRASGGETTDLRLALNLSGLMLTLVFLGHQWAYWTMDVEFNMGGRYILVAMVGLVLLLLTGVRYLLGPRARPVWAGWLVALLVMDALSAWNILAVLNPRYAPGWRMFHFPGE